MRNVACVVGLAALSLPGASLAQATSSAEETNGPVRLLEGVPATTTHSADEAVTYRFEGEPGQTYLIRVDQQVLDLIVTVEEPSGDVRTFNSPLFHDGPEFVLLEEVTAGDHEIAIATEDLTDAPDSHVIVVSSLGGEARDLRYTDAWRLMGNGAAANADGSLGREALADYERAAGLWGELSETRLRAHSLFSAAMVRYWSLYEWERSAEQATEAAELYEALGERRLYGQALLTRAYALMEVALLAGQDGGQATFDDAMDAFHASRDVHEVLGDDFRLAHAENYIGLAYYNRGDIAGGDYREARNHFGRASALFSNVGQWLEALRVRQNLALVDVDEGYAAKAAREFADIVARIPEGHASRDRASVLSNLGLARLYAGDFDGALAAFSEALEIFSNAERSEQWQGHAARGLGSTYYALGELERAEEYLRQALEKLADDGRTRPAVLANLGDVAYLEGDYARALDLHERAVRGMTSDSDRDYRTTFVARDLIELGRYTDAIAVAGGVLASSEAGTATHADAALQLGFAHLGAGNAERAAAQFDAALAFYDAVGLEVEQAKALKGRALAARDAGDLAGAIGYGADALRRIESLRTNVSAPELRAFYSAAQREHYETQIDLLMSAHAAGARDDALAAALSVSERARARMTAELLSEAATEFNRNVAPSTLARRSELYEELNALRYRRDRLLETAAPLGRELDELLGRMIDVENDLSLLETEIRRSDPRYAEHIAADPLGAEEIQAALDSRSALLQYALGRDKSYAWLVTSDGLEAVELADRETIEASARKAYEALSRYPRAPGSEDVSEVLNELSELVVAPVAPLLGSRERVIVAADGALAYTPFGVLPVEVNGESMPLLEAFELTSTPSMSVREAQRSRERQEPPRRALAVFADPVFEPSDSRFADPQTTAALGETPPASALTRSSVDSRLARLPATGAEARALAELVPAQSRLIATGFDASRESALSADLSDYRIVHFATHGLVDSRYPGLSSLALSQFDADGSPRNGYLRLHDIYGMRLNADLVVLSGCETALGREIRGEGLVGLVQGFLYAGARNLVVSLWQVPDRATAELMARFYGHVLNEGLAPAEALRQAQISIAAERRWSDPYFWGAFVVVEGE